MMARRPTAEAAIRRLAFKLLDRVETFLDENENLSSNDLDRVGGLLKDAAAVLGVRSKLDTEEQLAKIAVLVRRADADAKTDRSLVVEFGEGVEEATV